MEKTVSYYVDQLMEAKKVKNEEITKQIVYEIATTQSHRFFEDVVVAMFIKLFTNGGHKISERTARFIVKVVEIPIILWVFKWEVLAIATLFYVISSVMF